MAWQGSSTLAQQDYLRTAAMSMTYVAEIGFNEGASAAALLSANPVIRVVSFEIAGHWDVDAAKLRIDCAFPGRHRLVPGDSRETVPAYYGPLPFGLVYVDGGHDYETVKADLINSLELLRPGGLVICDDLTPWKPWGKGPAQAWAELTAGGDVTQIDLRMDGVQVGVIPETGPGDARVWATGRLM